MKHFFTFLLCIFCISTNLFSQLNLQPYSGNPVVTFGNPNTWDDSGLWWPSVTVVNDTFYMLYNGSGNWPSEPPSIGLAISTDGYTFTKSAANPIMAADSNGFDAYAVDAGALYYENNTWYLYYAGRSVAPPQPGSIIGRATAGNPHGPWSRSNETLLTVGSPGEWDDEFISPRTILRNDTGLVMYYWAGNTWFGVGRKAQIGMATSTDNGITWQKYDNPATTAAPYSESDPVLKPGPHSYDIDEIMGCSVMKSDTTWEMFYSGTNNNYFRICYAVSDNGITWNKHINNPILTPSQDPLATNWLQGSAAVLWDTTYFVYYDYGITIHGIGLATAPDSVNLIRKLHDLSPYSFNISQNYPNPFNPKTTIEFSIPKADFVTLKIYNLLGQEVETLVSKKLITGNYKFDWNAEQYASGIYYYRISTESGFEKTRKLVLMK